MKKCTFIKTGVLAAVFSCAVFPGSWKVVRSFPAPSPTPNGLAWDGTHLWHAAEYTPVIYKLDPVSGAVISSIETNVHDQGDIAFHNGQLWVVSEYEHVLYQINPNTGATIRRIEFDISQEVEPGRRTRDAFEGLTSDGNSLWLDYFGREIYRIDPENGERVLRYQRDFGGYADGLAWGWGSLFMSTNSTEILEIEACTGIILEVFKAPAGVRHGPEGMTFDGEYLWYADKSSYRIYQIQLMDDYLVKKAAGKAINPDNCTGDELAVNVIPASYLEFSHTNVMKFANSCFIRHGKRVFRLDGISLDAYN